MKHLKEHCDLTLPEEMNGIKFQYGCYYLVNKKDLEPYIKDDEKDTDYKSITLGLDCIEYPFLQKIVYCAFFFTDLKRVGISGTVCSVQDDIKNKKKAREEFLKRLQEILPKLNLKIDLKHLIKTKEKLTKKFKDISIELEQIENVLNLNLNSH